MSPDPGAAGLAGLVVAAALRPEVMALRRGLGTVPVVRVGIGPARAAAAAARLDAKPGRALVLAGVCGGLRPGTRAGEVMVATEIRSEGGGVATTGAEIVAEALRAAGYPVRCGALWTASRIVGHAERRRLAARGVLGVDMESFPLARLGVPFVAVRSVVDTPEQGLLHPATLRNGPRALRGLAGFGPALLAWWAGVSEGRGWASASASRTTE